MKQVHYHQHGTAPVLLHVVEHDEPSGTVSLARDPGGPVIMRGVKLGPAIPGNATPADDEGRPVALPTPPSVEELQARVTDLDAQLSASQAKVAELEALLTQPPEENDKKSRK